MAEGFRLEMQGISKRFSAVKALDDVSLSVKPGEVHALIGENGAGKSTLMKILSGAYTRDAGDIYVDGEKTDYTKPRKALELGISVIYQEFVLANDLSVAENIFIDHLAEKGFLINWRKLRQKAAQQLASLGFGDIDPAAKVETLSVAYQQVVEICKCLVRNAKVLVLDEPTAVLTFAEIEKLFGIIRRLRDEGVSIIYISHRLEEIFELSDRITVLKDGATVGTVNTADIDKEQLVTMMVGRELKQMFPERNATIGEEVLRVENLRAGKMVEDVSFSVKAGEVVGFSGLVGAGRSEAMRALFGVDKVDDGSITLFGETVAFRHPKQAVQKGLGMLPEDRKKDGLVLDKSIRINTTMAAMKRVLNKADIIKGKEEKKLVTDLLASIATKYNSIEDNASSLSGGNQQKIVLAKWIAANCRCIIFDEPTRGVDVGAKTEIYRIINQLAEQGVAVIVISSEMTEIIGFCDRAIVMRNGRVVGEVDKDALTEEALIKLSMGVA